MSPRTQSSHPRASRVPGSAPARAALLAAALLAAGAIPAAQRATEVSAVHRDGQTFVTWREDPEPGTKYRVYRSLLPFRSEADLAGADELGEVDDRSSRNQGRSLATGVESTWVIAPGGPELDVDQGLFVYTVEHGTTHAQYAVTSVRGGVEDRTIVRGLNSTRGQLLEFPGAPQPVLQTSGEGLELWGHWVGNRDTPFQQALSPWPSRGFNFLFRPGTASGKRGLVLALHAAGQTYAQAWPQRFELPNDVDLLQLSDLMPYTSWSFWFGSQELLPGSAQAGTHVWNYTQQRIAWTLDWMAARLGAAHDPERVYVVGGSMGAIGGMYLIEEYPERFAAAVLRNGLYDLEASDYRNKNIFQQIFGDFALNLTTRAGLRVLDRTNASFMAARDPRQEWPLIRTLNGREDETVGWSSAVGLYAGLRAAGRPAIHYFDERIHNPNGYWHELERKLLARMCLVSRDRPSLRFDDCTLDDWPGDGQRDVGDPVGAINACVDYDARTAVSTEETLDFEVFLRSSGALDDAPAPRALAALTPCRTGPFAPESGEEVHYLLKDGAGRVVDERLLVTDANGRVHTPLVPLEIARRFAHFQRHAPEASAPLFVSRAVRRGESMQIVLRGTPGAAWRVLLVLSDAGALSGLVRELSGTFGPDGRVERAPRVPYYVPEHARVLVRAEVGGVAQPLGWARVDRWVRPGPSQTHGRR